MAVLPEPQLPASAGPFTDGDLSLELVALVPSDPARGWVPYYQFAIRTPSAGTVGRIALRAAHSHFLDHYAGQIGYSVEASHRGHRYAARAVRLLVPFACQLGFETLWITCDPSNAASRRSAELAGATYIETVPLPADCDMYRAGDRYRRRYRVDVGQY